MAVGEELKRYLPQVVMGLLAARMGGMPAVAGYQRGVYERQEAEAARARQAQIDEERRQAAAAEDARAQVAEVRARRNEQRQIDAAALAGEEAARRRGLEAFDRLDRFRADVGETAASPIAAENAMLGRAANLEPLYGLKQGALSSAIPNMEPVITRGVRADARVLLTEAEEAGQKQAKAMGGLDPGWMVDDASVAYDWNKATPRLQAYLRDTGHKEGDPFKPSQLRAIAGSVTVTPTTAKGMTYGELFPQARGTAHASVPVPMKDGRVDLSEASLTAGRMGWVTDRVGDKQIRDAAVQALRDRLRYALRNPGHGGASTIARQLRAYGLDPQVELDKAARDIEGDNISRARTLSDLGPDASSFRTVDDMLRQFTFDSDPDARGRALENIRDVLPGPVGTNQQVPGAVYDFVPGKGLVPVTR